MTAFPFPPSVCSGCGIDLWTNSDAVIDNYGTKRGFKGDVRCFTFICDCGCITVTQVACADIIGLSSIDFQAWVCVLYGKMGIPMKPLNVKNRSI